MFRSSQEDDIRSRIQVMAHEAEHGVNINLKSRYDLLRTEKLGINSKLMERMQRRVDNPDSTVTKAKDELLSYLTVFECLDPTPEQYDVFDEYVGIQVEEIVDVLTDNKGIYYPSYQERFPDTDRKEYIQRLEDGAAAFLDLFNLYKGDFRSGKTDILPSRMAINVLEQFPVESWPAVARLLTLKHRQAKSSSKPK